MDEFVQVKMRFGGEPKETTLTRREAWALTSVLLSVLLRSGKGRYTVIFNAVLSILGMTASMILAVNGEWAPATYVAVMSFIIYRQMEKVLAVMSR